MASMNWLGFSLSPQELPAASNPHHHHHHDHQDHHSRSTVVSRLGFNSDEISGTDVSAGECFDLTSDHSTGAPSLNHLPPPFGILEAFNRTNHHSQGLFSPLIIFQANLKNTQKPFKMTLNSSFLCVSS